MNHAFLVLCHEKPIVLEKAISLLSSSNHYFFIHVDKKYKNIEDYKKIGSYNNVFFIKRIKVNWGGFNMVKATLNLINSAVNHNIKFDYFHLISGADFPCANNHLFDAFFDKANNYSYLSYDINQNEQLCNYRMNSYHLLDLFDIRKSKILLLKDYIEFFINKSFKRENTYNWKKGANWFSFHKDVIHFALKYIKDFPQFYSRFKYTECCDEIFFHTMLHPYIKDLRIETSTNLRYTDWDSKRPILSSPKILEDIDFNKIRESRALICRKVDPNISKNLIKMFESYIKENKSNSSPI